ncbi:MAG: hypothetical protein F4X18_06480 [Acidimicrobiia bacterium]|nr:hypothetical protein [Acidimicrobiia bacterium]MYB45554.1 hypothetical protein [Acidimicrobiia bacterium]MYC85155.1 hypothetical protein [Acidimicrobiia bacterium]
MSHPPGNSLQADQGARVSEPGTSLEEGILHLIERVREELDYSDAKGASGYRLGMHDGLRFTEDALVNLLNRHGYEARARATSMDT